MLGHRNGAQRGRDLHHADARVGCRVGEQHIAANRWCQRCQCSSAQPGERNIEAGVCRFGIVVHPRDRRTGDDVVELQCEHFAPCLLEFGKGIGVGSAVRERCGER